MSALGLGCAKTPALALHVEISRSNCISESQIILHTPGSMPCWRIVFFYISRMYEFLYQNSQTLTHAAGVLPGHPLQKRTEVQWDIGAALGADEGADESTSPQAGIRGRRCPS